MTEYPSLVLRGVVSVDQGVSDKGVRKADSSHHHQHEGVQEILTYLPLLWKVAVTRKTLQRAATFTKIDEVFNMVQRKVYFPKLISLIC